MLFALAILHLLGTISVVRPRFKMEGRLGGRSNSSLVEASMPMHKIFTSKFYAYKLERTEEEIPYLKTGPSVSYTTKSIPSFQQNE